MTRNWYQNPGQDGSFWVTPFYSTAQWDRTSASVTALRNGTHLTATGTINTGTNFATPFYIGVSTDPLVTVTDGTRSISVHIPLGAVIEHPVPSPGNQNIGGVDSTKPYLCWSAQDASMTVNGVTASAVAATGTTINTPELMIFDGSGPVMMDVVTNTTFPAANAFGLIQDYELQQALASDTYVIQHMLAYTLDASQVSSTAAAVWPLNLIDTSITNTGTLPQGLTVGIPADVVRPTGKTRGFYLLWDCLQQYGGFFYNLGGSGAINFSVFSQRTDSTTTTLINDIVSSVSAVVANLCILTNQTGVTSLKGFATGAQYAFTPPPTLDLTPTNGYVLPSTFGAWYATGRGQYYNTIGPLTFPAPQPAITIVTPPTQSTASGFTESGKLINYTAPPTLQYRDDTGTFVPLPVGAVITATDYSFLHPVMAAGTHTTSVRDANNTSVTVSTGQYQVAAPATTTITPTAPSGPLVNNSYTIRGTVAGYTTSPALSWNDGTGAVPFPAGSTITTTQFVFVHPGVSTSGSRTTTITDTAGGSGQITYTVGVPSGSVSQNLSTIFPGVGSLTDTDGNTWTISVGNLVCLNGLEDASSSGVQEMAWVNSQIWYENVSSQWFSKAHAANSWNGPQASPLGQAHAISVAAISGVQPATQFTSTGSLLNYAVAPSLTFSDDGGPAQSVPASGVTSTTFTLAHAGVTSGSHTLTISDGTTSGTVTYSVQVAGWTSLPTTTTLSATVAGLLQNTPYDFQVFGTNSGGQGPPTPVLTLATLATAVVAPSAPTGVTSTSVSNTSVNLSWTAPSVGTPPLTYQTQWSPTGTNNWTNGPLVGVTSAQVTGLSPGITYDFQVEAINSAGTSPFSGVFTTATTGGAAITWSRTINSPGVQFSSDTLTATAVGSGTPGSTKQGCFASASITAGQHWVQFTVTSPTKNVALGFGSNSYLPGSVDLGFDANGVGFYPFGSGTPGPQTAYYSGAQALFPGGTPTADISGAVVTLCVDADANLYWVQTPRMVALYGANAWNDSTANVPGVGAAGVGGLPLPFAGNVYPVFSTGEGGAVCVLNASSTVLGTVRIPTTFSSWGGVSQTVVAPSAVSELRTDNSVFNEEWPTQDVGWNGWAPQPSMATPGNGSFVFSGDTWTLTSGGVVQRNGSNAGFTSGVTMVCLVGTTVWSVNVSDNWFSWNGSSWDAGPAPILNGWIDHYPFGGNEYFLPFVGEAEYLVSSQAGYVSSTAYHPFSLSGGILTIKAQSVASSGISNPAGQPWNSGCITSCHEINGIPAPGLLSFKFGYLEVRCKVPSGGPTNSPGSWVVIAMYPQGNGLPGEIDILEHLGGSPTVARQTIHNGQGTTHEYDYAPGTDFSQAFHTYGVDWQSDFITFYVDGVQTGRQATTADMLQNNWYVNILLAIAGPTSWSGAPINATLVDPVFMLIDYVRVYANFAQSRLSGVTSTSVPLAWNSPSVGSIPLTYTVQYRVTGTTPWTTFGTTFFPTATVTGLVAGTQYDFQVFASNSAGTGGTSNITQATTVALPQVPGQPTGVAVGSPSNTAVTVTWRAPNTGGVPTSYQVQYKLHTSSTFLNAPAPESSDGTVLTSTSGSITDSAGNVWTLVASNISGLGVAQNGVLDPVTANVGTLLYWNRVVVQQNQAGNWYSMPGDTALAGDPRIVGGNPVSVSGTTLTSTSGSIRDQAGNLWTLVASSISGLGVAQNGVLDPVTANVTALVYWYGVVSQGNQAGNWYSMPGDVQIGGDPRQYSQTITGLALSTQYDFQVFARSASGSGPPSSPPVSATTTATASTGNFTIAAGKITDPSGVTFVSRGINVVDGSINSITPAKIKTFFPRCNLIRLAVGNSQHGFQTPAVNWATMKAWITAAVAAGMVVVVDDHEQHAGTAPYTGSALTADLAYVTQVGNDFKDEPHVWIQSMNEPGTTSGLSAYHKAFYDAFRATGAKNIVMHDVAGGNLPNTPSDSQTPYQAMTNTGWDAHFYNWMTGGNTNQTQVNTYLNSNIQTLINWTKMSDGTTNNTVVPCVWMGECGFLDYANNYNINVHGANGTKEIVIAALTTNVSTTGGKSSGCAIWLLDGNDPYGWGVNTDLLGNDASGNKYAAVTEYGVIWNNNA